MTELGKFAPEFQILTAVTALEASNFLRSAQINSITRWGVVHVANRMDFNYAVELPFAADVDLLLKHLATKLIGAPLRSRSFQLIRELLVQMPSSGTDWQKNRVDTAVYMIGMLPEFNILK
jgi:hypothetical protein